MIKCVSPALSSFFRRRFILTVSVFSSTNWSVSHSRSINFSRLITFPFCSIRQDKIRYSFLGIWRGNPRPFNDRDESAACFYHAINLPKAWSFLCSKKRNCLRQRNIGKIRVAVYRENNTVCIIYFNCLLTICILYDIIYVEKIT